MDKKPRLYGDNFNPPGLTMTFMIQEGCVITEYSQQIEWVAMTPAQAREFAEYLLAGARQAESYPALTSRVLVHGKPDEG